MSNIHIPSDIPIQYLPRSKKANTVFLGMFLVGLAGFVFALTTDPDRAWQSYVSNWLFFTNIAMGAMLLTVVTWITKAKWNWSVRRVSLAFVAFLPISFVMFLPMLTLGESYFPWIAEVAQDPILQKKAAYLNMPFLLARNVIGVLVLFGVSLYFAYLALRPDMGLTSARTDHPACLRDLDFVQALFGLGVAHVQGLEGIDDRLCDDDVAVPLAVRRHHVPRGVIGARASQRGRIGLHVVIP